MKISEFKANYDCVVIYNFIRESLFILQAQMHIYRNSEQKDTANVNENEYVQ